MDLVIAFAMIAGLGFGFGVGILGNFIISTRPLINDIRRLRYDGFRPEPVPPRPKTVPPPPSVNET